jgi:Tfp pilus assembly protein PilV
MRMEGKSFAVSFRRSSRAFTLIEVMIASGILFICLFAILGLLANTLKNARALQRKPVDAGMLAAQLCLTNKLRESSDSGNFGDDFPGYHWRSEIFSAQTNGLFAADFTVFHAANNVPESHMTILLFRPESATTPGGNAPAPGGALRR